MEGNICRCGTQPRIVLAIQRAAKAMDESKQ
jgi:aerobic-type carbon monoxide dehydrogenase small subunit (CoxS/CutS family)